ncbi:MAG: hypothetical protein ACRD0P_01035 [Stackebrandtia sp.]
MQSQWNNNSEDVPAKMGKAWDKTKAGAGTGKVVAIAAGVVAVVLIIGVVIATIGGGSGTVDEGADKSSAKNSEAADDSKPDASYPKEGEYEIQVQHSGFCVGTDKQDGEDREVLVQQSCKDVVPKITLKTTPVNGVYTVGLSYEKENFDACLAADSEKVGDLLGPQQCSKGKDQQFSLEAAGDKSFNLLTSGGKCVGVPEGSADSGAMFAVSKCEKSAAYQRLKFEGGDVPGMPTKLGAWWASEGKYGAKWEAPKDDGGSDLTGFIVSECESGDELWKIDGDKYKEQAGDKGGNNDGIWEVTFEAEKIKCISVRAVNSSGEGQEATFKIEG